MQSWDSNLKHFIFCETEIGIRGFQSLLRRERMAALALLTPVADHGTEMLQRLEASSAGAENKLLTSKDILNLVIRSPMNSNLDTFYLSVVACSSIYFSLVIVRTVCVL